MNPARLPLIVGISLPIVFIAIISIAIFGPSLFVKPEHNFIYSNEPTYYGYYSREYQNTYTVQNGRIVLEPLLPREGEVIQRESEGAVKVAPDLYLYDVKAHSTHLITLEEAQKYTVDPGPSSPDGYVVEYAYGHNGIFELFGSSSDDNGHFISKGNGKKKLSGLPGDRYSNQGNFRLIGWIK